MTTTKNQLSRILADVRRGESYVIFDRDVAVARIEPITPAEGLSALEVAGVVISPRTRLAFDEFRAMRRPRAEMNASAVDALLAERESSL